MALTLAQTSGSDSALSSAVDNYIRIILLDIRLDRIAIREIKIRHIHALAGDAAQGQLTHHIIAQLAAKSGYQNFHDYLLYRCVCCYPIGFGRGPRFSDSSSPHKLVINRPNGGFEIVVVHADDDAQLTGALVNHTDIDPGPAHG